MPQLRGGFMVNVSTFNDINIIIYKRHLSLIISRESVCVLMVLRIVPDFIRSILSQYSKASSGL